MKPIFLVLLVVTSALASPVITIDQYSENEIPRARETNKISSALVERAFDVLDGGDTNVYILNAEEIIKELASKSDARSQALAVAHAMGILIQMASGLPGDTCAAAALINAYVHAKESGSFAGLRPVLLHFFKRLSAGLEYVVKLVVNPSSVQYAAGPGTGCLGGGRHYQFEEAWEIILSRSNDDYEEYCVAKRLYNAFNARSNNVGALITVLSLPPVVEVFEQTLGPAMRFLQVVGNQKNAGGAAYGLSVSMLEAARNIKLD